MEQARTKDLLDRGVNEVLKPYLQALLIFFRFAFACKKYLKNTNKKS